MPFAHPGLSRPRPPVEPALELEFSSLMAASFACADAAIAAAAASASSASSGVRCQLHLRSECDFFSTCSVHVMRSLAFSPSWTTLMHAAGDSRDAALSASSTASASRDSAAISRVISPQSLP